MLLLLVTTSVFDRQELRNTLGVKYAPSSSGSTVTLIVSRPSSLVLVNPEGIVTITLPSCVSAVMSVFTYSGV